MDRLLGWHARGFRGACLRQDVFFPLMLISEVEITDICSAKCPETYCWKSLCKILLLIPPGRKCSWTPNGPRVLFQSPATPHPSFFQLQEPYHLLTPWRGWPTLSPRQVDQVNSQVFLFPGSLCYSEDLNREPELYQRQTTVALGVWGASTPCLLGT